LTSANSRHFVAKSPNRTCGTREPALKRRKGDFRYSHPISGPAVRPCRTPNGIPIAVTCDQEYRP
jgi:hypothetical protein